MQPHPLDLRVLAGTNRDAYLRLVELSCRMPPLDPEHLPMTCDQQAWLMRVLIVALATIRARLGGAEGLCRAGTSGMPGITTLHEDIVYCQRLLEGIHQVPLLWAAVQAVPVDAVRMCETEQYVGA